MELLTHYHILSLIIGINLLLSLVVLLHNPVRIVNWSFFITILGTALWGSGLVLLIQTGNFFIFDKVTLYGGLLMIGGFFMFAHVFPDRTTLPRSFWFLLVPLVAIAAVIPFNLIITAGVVHPNGVLEPTNGPLFPIFAALIASYVLYSLFLLIQHYRIAAVQARRRIQYFFLCIGVFFTCVLTTDVILPAIGIFQFNLIGPMTSLILVGGTTYAIVRHQLMDIRIIIQRSLIYALLVGLITGIYIFLLGFIGYLVGTHTELAILVSGVCTTLIGVFTIQPLERWFRRITDPIFFKDPYDYADALHTLSRVLNRNVNQKNLTHEITETIRHILKPISVTLVLTPNQQPPDDAGLHIPLRHETESLGYLILGGKRSGDPYTPEDIRLLKTFAHQAGVAFKKAELYERVRRHAQDLESKVQERTRALKASHKKQQRMLIDISHNLQTPLTVVKSELEVLRKSSADNHSLFMFERSIDDVSHFIYSLLRLARLESRIADEPQYSVSLSELLDELTEYFTILAEEKRIALETTIEPGIRIQGSRDELNELVVNLVSNAMKYMGKTTERRIALTLKKNDRNAVLEVTDTGKGIPQEKLPHIFERFYRGTETGSGSGLGLAICTAIVEKHHGTINVVSTVDKGTRFTVQLPLVSSTSARES